MKNHIIVSLQRILFSVGIAISFIFSARTIKIVKNFGNIYYSGWIKRSFKFCGKSPRIEYPIILEGAEFVTIGDYFECRGRLRIEAFSKFENQSFEPEIIIKNNVSINYDCHFGAIKLISIGNNVLIGSKVLITDHFHGQATKMSLTKTPKERELTCKGAVVIEDNVWIGEGAVIMPNVTIGKNAIIGANAVVTKSVPENCYAVGVPAKIIQINN